MAHYIEFLNGLSNRLAEVLEPAGTNPDPSIWQIPRVRVSVYLIYPTQQLIIKSLAQGPGSGGLTVLEFKLLTTGPLA